MNISDIDISLIVVISICYSLSSLLLHKYQAVYGLGAPFHESCVAAVLGIAIGAFSRLVLNKSISFNQDIFFYLVLPPIVFSAGYSLKKKKFFKYLHYISLFGIVGTLINFILIALSAYYFGVYFPKSGLEPLSWMESMLLASVLAANDEISAMSLIRIKDYPRLGGLIFGEGVLNDALSIVLFKSLFSLYRSSQSMSIDDDSSQAYPSMIGLSVSVFVQIVYSTLIGLVCGLLNARFLKVFVFSRKHPIHQTSLVLLTGYLSYFIAESTGVSGILTLFVTAVTLSHYSWHSLSKSAQLSTRIMFVSLSDLAEGFSFAYVGLSLWDYTSNEINISFAVFMLSTVIISRCLTIFTLCGVTSLMSALPHVVKSLVWGRLRTAPNGGGTGSLLTEATHLELPPSVLNHGNNGSNRYGLSELSPPDNPDSTSPSSGGGIPFREQLAFVLGGSVRGCLCWAQVLQLQGMDLLVTSTLIIVLVTSIGCGIMIPIVMPSLVEAPNPHHKQRVANIHQRDSRVAGGSTDWSKVNNCMNSLGSVQSSHSSKSRSQGSRPQTTDCNESTFSLHMEVSDEDNSDGSIIGDDEYDVDSSPNDRNTQPINSRQRAAKSYESFSYLFVLWVRVDELLLKPMFGGSKTDAKRSRLIELSQNLDVITMLSPIKSITIDEDELNMTNLVTIGTRDYEEGLLGGVNISVGDLECMSHDDGSPASYMRQHNISSNANNNNIDNNKISNSSSSNGNNGNNSIYFKPHAQYQQQQVQHSGGAFYSSKHYYQVPEDEYESEAASFNSIKKVINFED